MIVFVILNHFPVFCETESACQFLLGNKSAGISDGAVVSEAWMTGICRDGCSWDVLTPIHQANAPE